MLTPLQASQRVCRAFAHAFVNPLRGDLQNFVSQYSFRDNSFNSRVNAMSLPGLCPQLAQTLNFIW
jgi:hypothetical protein